MNSNRSSDENDAYELGNLRKMAKTASIYHSNRVKFKRDRNLSHIVHASLHLFQCIICLALEVFHHAHHEANRVNRKDDESIPFLPQEKNPIFYIYPICIFTSIIFAALWLFTDILIKRPQIAVTDCFIAAVLLLSAGIIEMKHVDMYLDLTKIKDEELLNHPIFIHNFIMSLFSIFCMTIYLIQGWILVDYWLQIKKQRNVSNDQEVSDSSGDNGIIEHYLPQSCIRKWKNKDKEEPGKLDPIPTLEKFPSLMSTSQPETRAKRTKLRRGCCCCSPSHSAHHTLQR
ncbi:uncharacterized protein LOC117602448 isoform X2 [Osmia lignaria lignaria]|uniref:uncharacterized protein LOC117602448 isoform X2 n=1 Tax=Osmia lignaria lignaria TaxID=1437193 RepID=UPI001478AFCA|nr:uncharacterized protein LOC117602448 isoform X2 [Osmia lignaria]